MACFCSVMCLVAKHFIFARANLYDTILSYTWLSHVIYYDRNFVPFARARLFYDTCKHAVGFIKPNMFGGKHVVCICNN